ncbi:hypothetical protein COY95_00655 [Candidatus Woesearchaeota archaeon CG_4_10_14_0_8_um_filter_47_5]|nr:MAG: hypothetical protein COY95_00655 [Candidatus Woesearchaeota archaeon CG_4_10_14_0_8_um_filter_47_5]
MNRNHVGIIHILISAFFVSLMGIFIRLIDKEVPPVTQVMIRIVLATFLLFLFFSLKTIKERKKDFLKADRKSFWLLAAAGIFGYALMVVFFSYAFLNTTFGIASTLVQLTPVFTFVFSYLFLRRNVGRHHVISLVVGIAGVVLLFGPSGSGNLGGNVFALLSAGLNGMYFVILNYMGNKNSLSTNTLYTFLFASLVLIPFSFIMERPLALSISGITWGYLVFMALNNIAAMYFLNSGLRYISPNRASIVRLSAVFLGFVYSVVLYHESIAFVEVLGCALIILSIVVISGKGK